MTRTNEPSLLKIMAAKILNVDGSSLPQEDESLKRFLLDAIEKKLQNGENIDDKDAIISVLQKIGCSPELMNRIMQMQGRAGADLSVSKVGDVAIVKDQNKSHKEEIQEFVQAVENVISNLMEDFKVKDGSEQIHEFEIKKGMVAEIKSEEEKEELREELNYFEVNVVSVSDKSPEAMVTAKNAIEAAEKEIEALKEKFSVDGSESECKYSKETIASETGDTHIFSVHVPDDSVESVSKSSPKYKTISNIISFASREDVMQVVGNRMREIIAERQKQGSDLSVRNGGEGSLLSKLPHSSIELLFGGGLLSGGPQSVVR